MMTINQPKQASDFDWRLAWKCVIGFVALHLVYRATAYALGDELTTMLDPSFWYAMGFAVALSLALCGILSAVAGRGLAIGLASAVVLALPTSLAFAAGELALQYHLSPRVNGTATIRTLADGTVVTQSPSGEVSYRRKGEERATVVQLPPLKKRIRDCPSSEHLAQLAA